jgi:NAD(P)H-flavin reductase
MTSPDNPAYPHRCEVVSLHRLEDGTRTIEIALPAAASLVALGTVVELWLPNRHDG